MDLTQQQVDAVKQGEPVRLLPPEVGAECVVVLAGIYERTQSLLEESLDCSQIGQLVDQTMGEYDEHDPLLDSYQKYRS